MSIKPPFSFKKWIDIHTHIIPEHLPELAVKELERCVKNIGLTGIQIGTHISENI